METGDISSLLFKVSVTSSPRTFFPRSQGLVDWERGGGGVGDVGQVVREDQLTGNCLLEKYSC